MSVDIGDRDRDLQAFEKHTVNEMVRVQTMVSDGHKV